MSQPHNATWQEDWQPLVDAVGRDFSDGSTVYGADAVEAGSIRRWLEPLEFDCALHYDEQAALDHGLTAISAPYTAALTFAIPATWIPGREVFTSAERDAQPAYTPINKPDLKLGPETTGFFATDIELDFVRPAVLGERLGVRGFRLISCVPKQTSVGRGAFMTWESEVVDAHGEVVVRQRTSTYAYNPIDSDSAATQELS